MILVIGKSGMQLPDAREVMSLQFGPYTRKVEFRTKAGKVVRFSRKNNGVDALNYPSLKARALSARLLKVKPGEAKRELKMLSNHILGLAKKTPRLRARLNKNVERKYRLKQRRGSQL